MRLPGFACALVLSACFSKPGYRAPDDGHSDGRTDGAIVGPLPKVEVIGTGTNDAVVLKADEYELTLSDADVRFPTALTVGGTEVLGRAGSCGDEDRVGIAFYPAASVTANNALWPPDGTPMNAPTSTATVAARGPAFGRVNVMWQAAQYSCVGMQQPSGSTQLTVFPDGRIIRHDQVRPVTTTITDPTAITCGCSVGDPDFYLTSFITLSNTAFDRSVYEHNGAPIDTTLPVPDVPATLDDDNPHWGCFEARSGATSLRRVGVAWTTPAATQNNGTRIKLQSEATTFVFDWIHSQPSLPQGSYTTDSAWFVNAGSDASCGYGVMNPLALAFATPPKLSIGPTSATGQVVDLDQMTGVYQTTVAVPMTTWYVRVDGSTPTPIAPGFALSLRMMTTDPPHVFLGSQELVDGTDFRYQIDVGTSPPIHSWWFPTSLATTDVLRFDTP